MNIPTVRRVNDERGRLHQRHVHEVRLFHDDVARRTLDPVGVLACRSGMSIPAAALLVWLADQARTELTGQWVARPGWLVDGATVSVEPLAAAGRFRVTWGEGPALEMSADEVRSTVRRGEAPAAHQHRPMVRRHRVAAEA